MNYKKIKGLNNKGLGVLLGTSILSLSLVACQTSEVSVSTTTEESETSQTETTETESEEVGQTESGMLDASEMFTDRDKEIGYDESDSQVIDLSESGTVTITDEGTYILEGTMSEGQVIVDAQNAKVQLVLAGVNITNSNMAAIYVKNADKVFVTLKEGTDNILTTTGEFEASDNNVDGVIFSKATICFNGNGNLTVESACGHGIVSKDDLKITSGTYQITAANHGLAGKDSVRIANGDITITSGKDGIHSENTEDEEKGFIYIADGQIHITSEGDGMDSSNIIQVDNGTIDIVSGGGNEKAEKKTEREPMPGGGHGGDFDPGKMNMTPPENGERPEMPADGERPEMPENGEMPQKPENQSAKAEVPSTDNFTTEETKKANAENAETESEETLEEDTVSTKGMKAEKAIYLNAGIITIDACDDAIHSNGALQVKDGTIQLSTGDDGLHAGEDLVIDGGKIDVDVSYEGIEGLTITINGGNINVVSSDDGLNAAGGNDASGFGGFGPDSFGASEDCWILLNGGELYIKAGGDGIDSNGNLDITGGLIYVDGPSDNGNAAIDYGDGATATITGGTVVAVGSSGMAENFDDGSTQGSMLVVLDDQIDAETVTLTDADGNTIITYNPAKTYNCVVISSPEIKQGETYTLTAGSTQKTIEMESILYTNKEKGSHPTDRPQKQ